MLGKCAFWNQTANSWDSRGCKTLSEREGSLTCACSHLTSFAVVQDTVQYVGSVLLSAGDLEREVHTDERRTRAAWTAMVSSGVPYLWGLFNPPSPHIMLNRPRIVSPASPEQREAAMYHTTRHLLRLHGLPDPLRIFVVPCHRISSVAWDCC